MKQRTQVDVRRLANHEDHGQDYEGRQALVVVSQSQQRARSLRSPQARESHKVAGIASRQCAPLHRF